jgi:hypothetical protein
VRAEWLEETVWSDVRRFLENPGEVLERVHAQGAETDAEGLASRHDDLKGRLAEKHTERDRWLRLYAQGHISDAELETHLSDLGTQTKNLRLLLGAVEADLAQRHEQAELAASTETWLLALRERIAEVEGDTPEAFLKRRRLVELLVAGITTGKGAQGRPEVQITYRFGPPNAAGSEGEETFVGGVQSPPAQFALKHASKSFGKRSRMPPVLKAPAL